MTRMTQEEFAQRRIGRVAGRSRAEFRTMEGLTGIKDLAGTYPGGTAVVCCSGTTLREYDDKIPPRSWPRFAVNEAIRGLGTRATFWVLSDTPIVEEYSRYAPDSTTILAMHDGGPAARGSRQLRGKRVLTVDSTPQPLEYQDGLRFFSRGTVLIGALEMARYMGIRRAFIFGLDCYRTDAAYYFDGRKHPISSERALLEAMRVKTVDKRIYVTPRLRRMVDKLNEARESGLWANMELYCVGSPLSQQTAIELLSIDDFCALVDREERNPEAGPPADRRGSEATVDSPEGESAEFSPADLAGEPADAEAAVVGTPPGDPPPVAKRPRGRPRKNTQTQPPEPQP